MHLKGYAKVAFFGEWQRRPCGQIQAEFLSSTAPFSERFTIPLRMMCNELNAVLYSKQTILRRARMTYFH